MLIVRKRVKKCEFYQIIFLSLLNNFSKIMLTFLAVKETNTKTKYSFEMFTKAAFTQVIY